MAIEIGECLPIVKRGMTPVSSSHREYKVKGLPEWMIAKLKTSDGARWVFSFRTTEERPGPIKYPKAKSPSTPYYRSRDKALDGLRQYLRDHFAD